MYQIILIVILIIIIIVALIYNADKRNKFKKEATELIHSKFPNINVQTVFESGWGRRTHVKATGSSNDNLRLLNVSEKIERRGNHSVAYTIIRAVLVIPTYPYSFTCKIRKEGLFNKVFRGENVIVGPPKIDNALLLNANRPAEAKEFFLNNLSFISSLSQSYSLYECNISNEMFGDFSLLLQLKGLKIDHVKEALSLIRKLLPKDSEFYDRSDDIDYGPQPVILGIDKTEIADIGFLNLQEAFNYLQKKTKFLKIDDKSAITTSEKGLFEVIEWKWDENKIHLSARGVVDSEVKLKIRIESKALYKGIKFDWFKPFELIDVVVEPIFLDDEILSAYDIAMVFVKLRREKLIPTLEFEASNGEAKIDIVVENNPRNVNLLFDLIQLSSWKWITSFIIVENDTEEQDREER